MKNLTLTTAIALALAAGAPHAFAQSNTDTSAAANTATTQQPGQAMAAGDFSCEQPFGRVDTDGNGFVSQSEASAHLDAAFSALDADGNDEISRSEYTDCLTRSAQGMPSGIERTEDRFAEIDANTDTLLDRSEFTRSAQQAWETTRQPGSMEARPDATEEEWESLRNYVFQATQDDEELKGLRADEAAARVNYTFDSLDENDDGMVSMTEWKGSEAADANVEQQAGARFDTMDADKSDSLNRSEFDSAMQGDIDTSTTAGTSGESGQQADASDAEGTPVFLYRVITFR